MSHHHEKATSELLRAVQKVLVQGLQDPRAEGSLITVTSVHLSPDGHNATVAVSVLPEKNESKVRGALEHSRAYIRREAAELLALKFMPQLSFVIDRSFKKQAEVLQALSKVAAEREKSAAQGDQPPAAEQEPPHGKP
ncbi:MAG: 30S ribosome-binding factor RbfA [Phycisphaerales bacterium]|nr:30S ribosome-binding factor RbfA [Phycisphaerales bacterium]